MGSLVEREICKIGDVLFMKDKKTITLSIIMLIITFIIIYTINNYYDSEDKINICKTENCNEPCISYKIGHETFSGTYCEKHTCIEADCYNGIEFGQYGDGNYCTYHKSKNDYEEQNKIILSDSQIEEIKKVVDEYCELIMSKHSNILAINLINNTPETGTIYIKYRCNVVREDSNTNLATIYILMQDDGTFRVTELEYDK